MASIYVGQPAINRPNSSASNYTWISDYLPADGNGIIDIVNFWANSTPLGNMYIGIFEKLAFRLYKCRSAMNFATTAGFHSYGAALDIKVGDSIGHFNCVMKVTIDGGGAVYRSASNVNGCVAGQQISMVLGPYANLYSLNGTGHTTGGKLYLGGISAAKRMRPMGGF